MRQGRLTKRMIERVRERQVYESNRATNVRIAFDQADQYQACASPAAYAEFDAGEGQTIRVDMLKCCHCGRFFGVRKKGRHGYCTRCSARTCGDVGCDACRPCQDATRRFGKA